MAKKVIKPASDEMVSYDQTSSVPVPKVAAAGVAGSITAILIWAAKQFFGIEIPGEIGGALATVISFIAAYFTQDKKPASAVPIIQG